jgi:signal transduction histidine kinase/integral membrane sensor domain MASE1
MGLVLAIAGAYYAGSRIGALLTFSPLSPSVLWPPNAILTAALLLTSPRRWWLCLLAAFPVHLAVLLLTPRSLTLILVLFLTNCSEALIAAGIVRHFGPSGPALFGSLRGVGIFVAGAAFVAPFLSSFWDAGAVALLADAAYWPMWRTRFFANALTELTLVPTLVTLLGTRWTWRLRGVNRRRLLEAAALWGGLGLVGVAVCYPAAGSLGFTFMLPVPFAIILSLLVWAAVRFGPAGTSLSVLTVEFIAIWGATHREWPFAALSPVDNVLPLQIFLLGVAIPLLFLAAIIEERQRDRKALEERLRFEEILSRLSRAFVHLPSYEVDRMIDQWLQRLGEYLETDHVAIFQLSGNDKTLVATHAWGALPRQQPGLPDGDGRLDDVPLMITDFGVLSFGARTNGGPWPPAMIPQLRLVAEIFGNAITRKQAESALRSSEIIKAAILESLTSGVAVLDRRGRVVASNETWHRLGSPPTAGRPRLAEGATGQDVCGWMLGAGSPHASEVETAIEQVIDGVRLDFALEYPRAGPAGERWFAMSVLPLTRADGGAVVSLTDVTERRRVELEAQQTRQELSHFTRVSTMGELTASLAHELSQPLTGILANAQAAQRYLGAAPPNLAEIRDSLDDIVADDRRAGEIIRRLRELLKKGQPRRVVLDLNALVSDVAKLVGSDALLRGVSITVELDPDLSPLRADRVQLQQVVLNLLMNAMEAMSALPASGRNVIIHSERLPDGGGHVSVADTGPGIAPDAVARIFEPFYTTKADGMGMGLSITRSIIEAHGGRVWADNSPTGGAIFHFTLTGPDPEHA